MRAIDKINQRIDELNSFLCIGLDPDQVTLDSHGFSPDLFEFNKQIIDHTHHYAVAYKPQFAHYAALGQEVALSKTIAYIQNTYPTIAVILDSKRGDIGSTAEKYAMESYEQYQADGVTLNPYMGLETLEPYYRYQDKLSIVLIKTSNKGSQDFQDLLINQQQTLYSYIAERVIDRFGPEATMFVVGATATDALATLRASFPSVSFLVPGIGFQEGDLERVVEAGISDRGHGLLLNVSRGITLVTEPTKNRSDYLEKVVQNSRQWHEKMSHLRDRYQR